MEVFVIAYYLVTDDVHIACMDHNPNLYNYGSDTRKGGDEVLGGKTWNVGSTISFARLGPQLF